MLECETLRRKLVEHTADHEKQLNTLRLQQVQICLCACVCWENAPLRDTGVAFHRNSDSKKRRQLQRQRQQQLQRQLQRQCWRRRRRRQRRQRRRQRRQRRRRQQTARFRGPPRRWARRRANGISFDKRSQPQPEMWSTTCNCYDDHCHHKPPIKSCVVFIGACRRHPVACSEPPCACWSSGRGHLLLSLN